MTLYDDALLFATLAHAGMVDKVGVTYIKHPIAVAKAVTGETRKAAALLHDVIEDTGTSAEDLLAADFPGAVVDIVVILSRDKETETHFEYIDRVVASGNADAIAVKIADTKHNLTRPYPGDGKLKARYAKTIKKLKGII
jgi:(p)ppGpp synthase/HD superfamily hydrolase